MKQEAMNSNTHYTVILGAEGEFGRALAREVARKGSNLIIASTTTIDLQRFSIGLQLSEDVQVEAVKVDLADEQSIAEFCADMKQNYEIKAIINNVSCDRSAAHNKCISEIATENFATRFRGTARIIMDLLPQVKQQPYAYLQHIIPFPYRKKEFSEELMASAGKMYAFALELGESLKKSPVSMSIFHPKSQFPLVPDLEVFDGIGGEIRFRSPRLMAIKAINGMLQGSRVIIPGFRNKVRYFLNRQTANLLRRAGENLEDSLQPST